MKNFDFGAGWPRVVEFREMRSLQGRWLGPERVRQVSTPPRREGPWWVRDVVETREGGGEGPPMLREASRLAWREDGLWQIGVLDGLGAYGAWDKPQLLLPADAKAGTVWGTVHRRGHVQLARACALVTSNLFADGVVVVADCRTEQMRTVTRDHWVPGVGWAGFEALLFTPQGILRVWSEDVVRDGIPAPRPALPVDDAPMAS